MASIWTKERIELLKKYWSEGLSATDCAVRMGLRPDRRSAVLGKIHRLKLSKSVTKENSPDYKPARRVPKPKPKKERRPLMFKSHRMSVPQVETPAGLPLGSIWPEDASPEMRVSLLDRADNGCCWVIGEPKGKCYCPNIRIPGSSWCETHTLRGYKVVQTQTVIPDAPVVTHKEPELV